MGRSALSCKFGTPRISETIRARKLKFYTPLDSAKYPFQARTFSLRGRGVGAAPYCKFGTPHISETTGDRKLKFCTPLDTAKNSFQI